MRTMRLTPESGILVLTVGNESFTYFVDAVRITPSAVTCTLSKPLDDPYYVTVTDYSRHCSCKGFKFSGHCKHVDAVKVLRERGDLEKLPSMFRADEQLSEIELDSF